jgi:hypothetical protein
MPPMEISTRKILAHKGSPAHTHRSTRALTHWRSIVPDTKHDINLFCEKRSPATTSPAHARRSQSHECHTADIRQCVQPERIVLETQEDIWRQHAVVRSCVATCSRMMCKPGVPARESNSPALNGTLSKSCRIKADHRDTFSAPPRP